MAGAYEDLAASDAKRSSIGEDGSGILVLNGAQM